MPFSWLVASLLLHRKYGAGITLLWLSIGGFSVVQRIVW